MKPSSELVAKWSEQIIGHGFTAVPNLLIEYRHYLGLSTTDFYVLLAIEKYRWDNVQKPWPSLASLAQLTNLSIKTIGRSTRNLEDKGLINKIHRAGTSNLYDLKPLVEELDYIADKLSKVTIPSDTDDQAIKSFLTIEAGHS